MEGKNKQVMACLELTKASLVIYARRPMAKTIATGFALSEVFHRRYLMFCSIRTASIEYGLAATGIDHT